MIKRLMVRSRFEEARKMEALKKTTVQSMAIAMFNSADEADIKASRQWRRVSDDR
jgi:hypothetical protein